MIQPTELDALNPQLIFLVAFLGEKQSLYAAKWSNNLTVQANQLLFG